MDPLNGERYKLDPNYPWCRAWRVFPKKEWPAAAKYLRRLNDLVRHARLPGDQYVCKPWIRRTRTRILVSQVRGLDV